MAQSLRFGPNVDPNTGGLAIAERERQSRVFAEEAVPAVRSAVGT